MFTIFGAGEGVQIQLSTSKKKKVPVQLGAFSEQYENRKMPLTPLVPPSFTLRKHFNCSPELRRKTFALRPSIGVKYEGLSVPLSLIQILLHRKVGCKGEQGAERAVGMNSIISKLCEL